MIMTATQIFEKGQLLTLAVAKTLIGKRIICTSPEYRHNTPHVLEFTIGSLMSEWDAYGPNGIEKDYNYGQFSNRQEYWESYMTKEQKDARKNTIVLIGTDGEWKYKCSPDGYFPEPTFTGSDADRPVSFMVIE